MKGLFLLISVWFYRISIALYGLGIKLYSSRSVKADLWIKGRQGLFEKIQAELKPGEERIWFHCASLGEFEQGRTLIEKIKKEQSELKIVLTFFSPSGYEIRKKYAYADYIFYLPMDTPENARRFIDLIKPRFAIFVKYEFWYFYFRTLEKRKIPLIMLSSIFHKNHVFFKWYGILWRRMLESVTHFFVQDHNSQLLLSRFDLGNITIIPDTRIDRVAEISASAMNVPFIEKFLGGEKAFIGGSVYKEECILIKKALDAGLIKSRIILAPHQVDPIHIKEIQDILGHACFLYSDPESYTGRQQILIINTIGLLSSIYKYGKVAFIGGGYGKGIHNILEPAAHGVPVIFGPNFHKFRESHDMLASNAAFVVNNYSSFEKVLIHLQKPDESENSGKAAGFYIRQRVGGTLKIYEFLVSRNLLNSQGRQQEK